MKIYNKIKTSIIENPDLEKGYLVEDKLIKHIEAVKEIKEISHYEVIKEYPNGGKDVKCVIDVPGVKAVAAHDEEENILIYIPYTEKELENIKLNNLREQRRSLLEAFDVWEKAVIRGREEDSIDIMNWYKSLLNLNESAFNNIPDKIKYYKQN